MKMIGLVPLVAFTLLGCKARSGESPLLRQVQTIALPGVAGRIDHMSADLAGKRLFVAALGNGTVEAIDLAAGKAAKRIEGLKEPQGVLFLPEANRLIVANGGGSAALIYDGTSLQLVARVALKDDPDNVRYDAAARRVYVGCGGGEDSALAVLDPEKAAKVGEIKLEGHPEAFELETKGPRIFVNVPTARHVAVVDRAKGAVVATWPLTEARSNFPMALDEASRRLLVGCRHPARLLVLDTESGKTVARLPVAGDADDVWLDRAARRIYVSGGGGSVSVIGQTDADHYSDLGSVPTASGARTSLFVPDTRTLYVAAPRTLMRGAEMIVLQAEALGK